MGSRADFDAAVVGGGISGCTTALHLARAGMRVAVFERTQLWRQASGVNAGTLSIQVKEPALIPYAMRSSELWQTTTEWLGAEVGFRRLGGLTLAFTDDEAGLLEARMTARRAAGAPIEFMNADQARTVEPALTARPVLASYCALDGLANTMLAARAYRSALLEAGVAIREHAPVEGIGTVAAGFELRLASGPVVARRLVMAGGIWLTRMLAWFGFEVPAECRINQVSVTERMPPILRTIIGIANGFLSLKQVDNGTVLIGGGWQGLGDADQGAVGLVPERVIGNIRIARHAVAAMARARVVRTWVGIEGHSRDYVPTVGPLPGVADAFVVGFMRGGFTNGPLAGLLLAQLMLGREPELPIFDPARLLGSGPGAAGRPPSRISHVASQSSPPRKRGARACDDAVALDSRLRGNDEGSAPGTARPWSAAAPLTERIA